MGRRSRRAHSAGSAGRHRSPGPGADAAPRSGPEADPAPPPERGQAMRRGYARGRERDEAIRAGLEPLGPGERPAPLTAAAILALLFAVANVIAALAGRDLAGEGADPVIVTAITTALLLIAAAGMLAARAWAVLGFMVILALQIVALSLALMIGSISTWWQVLLALAFVAGLGTLFWKLIRSLARLQMPSPPAR